MAKANKLADMKLPRTLLTLASTPKRFDLELVLEADMMAKLAEVMSVQPACVSEDDMYKKTLTVGCDFAGVATPCVALHMLGIKFDLLWATDISLPCQRMLKYHFGCDSSKIYGDVADVRLEDLQSPDVYIATPPCQSFSSAGKQLGTADARGALIFHPIKVAKILKPRVLILENVESFYRRFKETYQHVTKSLRDLGYTLLNDEHPIYNTCEHGVPQRRKRMILVAVLASPRNSESRTVVWTPPEKLRWCPKLKVFVDGDGASLELGSSQMQRVNSVLALQKDKEKDFVIDVAASEKFSTCTADIIPCMTASRAMAERGFYIHSKRACLSKSDKCRLQGLPPHFYRPRKAGIKPGQFGHQLGNAVSANVMMRLLPQILKAAGLLKQKAVVRDFWADLSKACHKHGLANEILDQSGLAPRKKRVVANINCSVPDSDDEPAVGHKRRKASN